MIQSPWRLSLWASAVAIVAFCVLLGRPKDSVSQLSLDEILRKEHQRGEHFASLLLLRVVGPDGTAFAWERKTEDYPLAAFAGCLSLLGGNQEGQEQPLATLARELQEELPAGLAKLCTQRAEKFGEFEVETGPPVYPKPIFFTAHVWHATVSEAEFAGVSQIPGEGRVVLANRSQLSSERFTWGYHLVWREYVRRMLRDEAFQTVPVPGIKVLDLRTGGYL